jgi:hypothetical protein
MCIYPYCAMGYLWARVHYVRRCLFSRPLLPDDILISAANDVLFACRGSDVPVVGYASSSTLFSNQV